MVVGTAPRIPRTMPYHTLTDVGAHLQSYHQLSRGIQVLKIPCWSFYLHLPARALLGMMVWGHHGVQTS